jgi:hypothetical protein
VASKNSPEVQAALALEYPAADSMMRFISIDNENETRRYIVLAYLSEFRIGDGE